MGHFGFSYVGMLYLLMLFIPNLIWTKHQPEGYDFGNENKGLLWCERIGQVGVSGCALIFTDFNLRPLTPWSLWLVLSFGLMLLYEGYWVRYFRSGRKLEDFYTGFCGVPLAGATLPVAAFLFLGIYGRVFLMVAFAVLLGVGHIGIHGQHFRELGQ
ncbi:hypothetical protein [Eubacterium sp. 1001713B170207_170306_E7]|uniref:hypothetical protein n=1 Tax=Eubacterium sp. 1001713B170207_170306_E7 TaxID=2787097 RepID=UPI00189B897E|nr:hypothetical protein [Eubacterium sp. 1001713B170207_170306_E7]